MLKQLIALVPGLFLAGTTLAAPFTISNEVSRGNCQADLYVEQDQDGGYLLVADFNDMVAEASSSLRRDFRHCTLTYNVNLEPGYVVRRIDSTVQGYYTSEAGGHVIVGVENRAVGSTHSVNRRYSFDAPGTALDINDLAGSIHRTDLPFAAQRPGATIGLNTKYTIEAVAPQGVPGETSVRLTTATAGSAHAYPICKIYVQQGS